MSPLEFDPYQVDHLFLLIGENPLPNYVAAKLLLKSKGMVYLVYTTGTVSQAERLAKILGNEGIQNRQLISLGEYESDAYHIREKLKQRIKNLQGRLGLNYTGGTKAMAVHAYRTFYNFNPDTIFSYLDPRRLEMCIDRENGERVREKIKPEFLEVKLAKLFQIHGWTWQTEPEYNPKLLEAAQAFAQFHVDEESGKLWRNWCNGILRKAARDKNNWLSENDLALLTPISLETIYTHDSIKQALSNLGITTSKLSLEIVKLQGLKKLKHVCEWLDGIWLEDYVLAQVKNLTSKLCIGDCGQSFKIRNPNQPNQQKFEFDIAFIRGYQLFAISCTTIDYKPNCKQKLFEAYIRAQQLGGAEARIALVCCASPKDVAALETEIVNVFSGNPDTKTKNNKLAVFGREDLPDLSQKIEEWIKANEREARK